MSEALSKFGRKNIVHIKRPRSCSLLCYSTFECWLARSLQAMDQAEPNGWFNLPCFLIGTVHFHFVTRWQDVQISDTFLRTCCSPVSFCSKVIKMKIHYCFYCLYGYAFFISVRYSCYTGFLCSLANIF